MKLLPVAFAGALVALPAQQNRTAVPPALTGLDPVALCAGDERPGQAELTCEHEGYRYLFANREHLDAFRQSPDRYAIQLGGACARMGPLSGLGDPQRYYVHEHRIYIFASDQCRAGFAADPTACLPHEDPRPDPDPAAAAQLARARARNGAMTFRTLQFRTQGRAGDYLVSRSFAVRNTDELAVQTIYRRQNEELVYAKVAGAEHAFFVEEGTVRPMARAARRELLHNLWREPTVALVRCEQATRGTRRRVGGIEVTELGVWIDGALTWFGLDGSGLVRTARFVGRAPDLRMREIVRVFEDHALAGGQLVPRRVRTFVEGREEPALLQQRQLLRVGAAVAPTHFQQPERSRRR